MTPAGPCISTARSLDAVGCDDAGTVLSSASEPSSPASAAAALSPASPNPEDAALMSPACRACYSQRRLRVQARAKCAHVRRVHLAHQSHRALPRPPRHSARHSRTRRTRRSADVAGFRCYLQGRLRVQARAKCAHVRRLRWPQVQPAASCYRSLHPHPRPALPPRATRERLRLVSRPLLARSKSQDSQECEVPIALTAYSFPT
jgi:hypothetical protein